MRQKNTVKEVSMRKKFSVSLERTFPSSGHRDKWVFGYTRLGSKSWSCECENGWHTVEGDGVRLAVRTERREPRASSAGGEGASHRS